MICNLVRDVAKGVLGLWHPLPPEDKLWENEEFVGDL